MVLKKAKLHTIYSQFEKQVAEFKHNAVCALGCTFCCTNMGNVDITTLEGLIIRERLKRLPERTRKGLSTRLTHNREERLNVRNTVCPFLDARGSCRIYDVRPFSCRQLYSLRPCSEGAGPMIHRQASELSRQTVQEIQQLDHTGYSGNHSFILHLLDQPDFRKVYLSDGFDPRAIINFGKSHGIMINRHAAGEQVFR